MEGKVTVLPHGPSGEVTATYPFPEEIFATPALAPGAVYIRTQSALYCFRSTN
jgi:hypothetical protein